MRPARAALWLLTVATANASALVACNAIVGVEDVRLKRDIADAADEEEVIDEPDADPGDGGRPQLENVFEVALGDQHTCARKTDGTVKCWGDDTQGQTGTGGAGDAGVVNQPTAVVGVDDALDIAAGKTHTCASRGTGKVSCWGFNLDGQLGNGETANRSAVPVDVVGLSDATYVAAGGNFSCAARAGGTVACWGGNGSGQLGTGSEAPSPVPVAVVDLKGAVSVAAGLAHGCAVKSDGSVVCWGDGLSGQLGNGAPARTSRPVPVSSLPPTSKVVAGERSTCALTRAGTVYCWGANDLGQLGDGTTNTDPNPNASLVGNLGGVVSLWAGKNHACAVKMSGSVVCWGSGSRGQLGDGQPRPDAGSAPTFVNVSGITNAIGVGTGGDHSCAPTKTNAIVCWGANDRGQLGNKSTATSELSPVSVIGYP